MYYVLCNVRYDTIRTITFNFGRGHDKYIYGYPLTFITYIVIIIN